MAARRPRLREISEKAGVSKATVDRVINNRAGVQEHTRRHVLSVAAELAGESPDARADAITLDFVIPDSRNAFMSQLIDELEAHARRRKDVRVAIHHLANIDAEDVAATLDRLAETSTAIGLIALDHHRVRATVRRLCERGIAIATIASDIRNVPRTFYAGVDNRAAGRLAGHLTGRLLCKETANVALILGARAYHGHEEREMGFRSVLRERFSGLTIVAEREIHENVDIAYRETAAILKAQPDLDAIYCIGAGQPGVARALIDNGRAGSVVFVAHGLSADTRGYLMDGVMDAVIDEDTSVIAEQVIERLVAGQNGLAPERMPAIRIQAIFPENIPVEP
ncbi:LacI family DNA-binding transcriptional regulator [Nitratireductor sp. XY-223]|uniref:LacI family DNA-binding transcriptional regulator n=1 Tax=Nitratireductor sp. XY-223 TaxID=2561926 RepID=UPI001FEFD8E1|nr:LacI family DNA-binding transcriptional regulator [Nitratireductor sp. XY-223]